VETLEGKLKRNPDDYTARRKLLVFYGPDFTGNVTARRRHILWLIEHHPDDPLAGSSEAHIFPKPPDPVPDPAGYAQAKRLWLKHTLNPDADVAVLSNAASFLQVADKPLAEELLLRGQAKAPYADWWADLGQLYATAILGSVASVRMGALQSVSADEAHSAYALTIREKLAASKDDQLLTVTGRFLVFVGSEVQRLDFDPIAMGKSYLRRALELNPQNTDARAFRASLARNERIQRTADILNGVPKGSEYQALASRPEAVRFLCLPWLTQKAWWEAEDANKRGEKSVAAIAWERTHKYADDLLTLAPRFKNSPDYGTALYIGNLSRSAVAAHEGRVRSAVAYLREAASAPPSDEIAFAAGDEATYALLAQLLKAGERDSVIQFLNRLAEIRVVQAPELRDAATAISNGRAPVWYSRLVR
jgi:hypothetical protein